MHFDGTVTGHAFLLVPKQVWEDGERPLVPIDVTSDSAGVQIMDRGDGTFFVTCENGGHKYINMQYIEPVSGKIKTKPILVGVLEEPPGEWYYPPKEFLGVKVEIQDLPPAPPGPPPPPAP